MTYELNHIRYNWKIIGGIAGIAGLVALVIGLCFALFILYAFSGFLGVPDATALFWAGGVVGIAGLTVAVIVFLMLSILILVYNYAAVPIVGGMRLDINQPSSQSKTI